MPCTDPGSDRRCSARSRCASFCIALLVAACGSPAERAPADPGSLTATTVAPAKPIPLPLPTVQPSPGVAASKALPEPKTMASWAQVRRQAAQRMVAGNAEITYMGRVPDMLLAIPVLEIELNGDGSVRRIDVLREPRQARDTLQIAADAVRRSAPYGNVSKLPKPWKFVETFLFDDARRFKPRSLED